MRTSLSLNELCTNRHAWLRIARCQIIPLSLVVLLNTATVYASEVVHVTIGRTYPIQEENLLAVIKQRAAGIDIQRLGGQIGPESVSKIGLPVATVESIRRFRPYFKSDFEVKKANGESIYPKGFRFNPLQQLQLNRRLVVLNEDQVEWVSAKLEANDLIMVAQGSVEVVTEKLQRRVYLLTDSIVERFGIREVPSILVQKGEQIEIVTLIQPESSGDKEILGEGIPNGDLASH